MGRIGRRARKVKLSPGTAGRRPRRTLQKAVVGIPINASSEESVGHRGAWMASGSSARETGKRRTARIQLFIFVAGMQA